MNKLSIYIHIPFCVSKCGYCDFLSFPGVKAFGGYVQALLSEIAACAKEFSEYEIDTVFFGGGTPTILPATELVRILDALRGSYHICENPEITVEANPETLEPEGLSLLLKNGVNRLSMGVQSFDDGLLKRIGRIHDAARAERAFNEARAAGFDNINLDLMFSLPGQSLKDWEATLDTALRLSPEHLSCYSLTVESDTPLGREGYTPDEDLDRAMYKMTRERLAAAGYKHYEISNFAKHGKQCAHNLVYWTGYEYRGFGLGAHSLTGGTRYHNDYNLEGYIAAAGYGGRQDEELLKTWDLMSEFMILGLRLMDGINCKDFFERFEKNIYEIFGDGIEAMAVEGLLDVSGGRIRLTDRGIDVSNRVMAHFV